MKTTGIMAFVALAAQGLAAPAVEKRSLVFHVSSEKDNKGIQKSWVFDRWQCHNLDQDDFDNQASWAYTDNVGLVNGCILYDDKDCEGDHVEIAKAAWVNLADVNFDKKATAIYCY